MGFSRSDLSGRHSLLTIPASVVFAVTLGLLGVPGTTHSLIIGAFAVALGIAFGRNQWLVAAGSFFAVFGATHLLASDVALSVLVAWAASAGSWWWAASRVPTKSRLVLAVAGAPALMLGTIPLALVVNSVTLADADVEATIREISGSLVTEHLVEPRWIEKVSYFGSQEGHIHTDSSGVLRSLKHYFVQVDDCRMRGDDACREVLDRYETELPPVSAPFEGTIRAVESTATDGRAADFTIHLTPKSHPNVEMVLFHVKVLAPEVASFASGGFGFDPFPEPLVILGAPLTGRSMDIDAGTLLGWGIEDVAVNVSAIGEPYQLIGTDGCGGGVLGTIISLNPACTRETRLVSYFSLLEPALLDDWRAWGIEAVDDVVLDRDEMTRDRFLTSRGGIYFVGTDEATIRASVADLTNRPADGEFVLESGDQLLVAVLDAGEVRVVRADGSGIEGCFCIARLDARPGERNFGDMSPATLLAGLPVGEPLRLQGGPPHAAGVVAAVDVPRVQRLVSGFLNRSTAAE